MKKTIYVLAIAAILGASSCQKNDFEDFYKDPSKLENTTVEKQFTGFMYSNKDYILPSYKNYFVVQRITSNRYNQAVAFVNQVDQYVPGASAAGERWDTYYNFLSQYRELEKIYNSTSSDEQKAKRIYMLAAKVYLYDHTQQIIDTHGDIPFSEAGFLSTNGGDYTKSYPKYDSAESIYTKMLDDLKDIANELNGLELANGVAIGFRKQDLLNEGDLNAWKKYVNSLRLRMLSRVSAVSSFSGRVDSEIAQILSNPTAYPVVLTNKENIAIEVKELGLFYKENDEFQTGLEGWNGNLAGKKILDHMVSNKDPRLTYVFESGLKADPGTYEGLDQMLNTSEQNLKVNSGKLTIYNRSTLSRNTFFPGLAITASQIQFLIAEYYLRTGNLAKAEESYSKGIKESFEFYKAVRAISNNSISPAPATVTDANINAYLGASEVKWSGASTPEAKLNLIALQKWIHFNVIQPNENWAELRRLDSPSLVFWNDAASSQQKPPYRWNYPNVERAYNTNNYNAVASKDNLTTKVFWDVK